MQIFLYWEFDSGRQDVCFFLFIYGSGEICCLVVKEITLRSAS